MTRIVTRNAPPRVVWQLEQQGLHPLLARLYAARGITDKAELDYELKSLIPPAALTHATDAAQLLADAIEAEAKLLIIGDYDCDGATATAVGMRALKSLGADVDFLLPDRFKLGYGLSPEIVDVAAEQSPDLIITVDNGIASLEGVARAQQHGIATLITDHHLPGDTLPDAECIVNPNQPGCGFPSKSIAGVGVMFYVMLALRAELRERGWFAPNNAERPEPNFASPLDLVAKRAPGLLVRFGGHAMAAGATLREGNFAQFSAVFAQVASELLDPAALTRTLETDGNLEGGYLSLEAARLLENEIWGQGFPAPLFCDDFDVEQQRVLKEKHLKLRLRKGNSRIDAIQFNFATQPGHRTRAAYRLAINEYMGVESPQLMIEHLD